MSANTLLELLSERVEKHPEALWLRDLHAETTNNWTWQEADIEIHAIASWLSQILGAPEQNISILSRNRAHWVLADMAALVSKNVSVPIFTTQSSKICEYIFEFTDVKVLFVGEAENWDKVKDVIPSDMVIVTFPGVEIDLPSLNWDDLVAEYKGQRVQCDSDRGDLVSIIFTSGTTGMPKGVMLSHDSLILSMRRTIDSLHLEEYPKLISYLPLSHIAERNGVEAHSLIQGGIISFIESQATLIRDLQRTQPTFFFGAPRIWEAFQQGIYQHFGGREAYEAALANNKRDVVAKARAFLGFQEIDLVSSGAAPISTSLLHFYQDLGITIIEGYGQTEALAAVCSSSEHRRIGSIGKPLRGMEARITSDGELLVRGPGFAIGYYKQPDKTAETFVDGWVHSGDRARVDEDGFYYITGRVKDYFKTIHGKYVAPIAIEDKFIETPLVDQLCLIGRGCSKTAMIVVPSSEGKSLPREQLEVNLREVARAVNDSLDEKHARIGVVLISSDEWTIENGFLTTTLKTKRQTIDETFLEIIQPLALRAAEQKEIIVEWVNAKAEA